MTATGNEANTRHHFQGALRREMDYEDVEISVAQDMACLLYTSVLHEVQFM